MDIGQILQDNGLKNATIINNHQEFSMPKLWQDILECETFDEKKKIALNKWKLFSEFLPKTIKLLENNLIDILVVTDSGQIKLLYLFEINDNILIYEGHIPTFEHSFLKNIPLDIRSFYTEIHNGWFESVSGGLGFLALDDIQFLDELEWGILDEIPTPNIDLSKTYYIFHNAGSGYLCINIENIETPEYLIWWSNKEPKFDIGFWSFIDSWIEIGLTN
jgi:hypothetical protein